jgi:hypothetical protein
MKLIDVDSKATLEDFLTLKKRLTRKIAQFFRFAEKSGDNHPKH